MHPTEYFKQFIRSAFVALLLLLSPTITQAAELYMVEEPGCVFCERFNREIGPAYPNTQEGKLLPLRRLQLTDPWPEMLARVTKPTVTPTFILVEDGVEIDRMLGYPGDEYFWFLLNKMISKL